MSEGKSDLLALPRVPWARPALELVEDGLGPSLAHHCIRSWIFARLLHEHEGRTDDVDPALLFAATLLHDIGLRADETSRSRFEVAGADVASGLLIEHGVRPTDADLVWEAIALHTSAGIAERRGPLAALTRRGIGVDLGRDAAWVDARQARLVHESYPRLGAATSLVDAIVEHASGDAARRPRLSPGGELSRERAVPPHVTEMERAELASRWARDPGVGSAEPVELGDGGPGGHDRVAGGR